MVAFAHFVWLAHALPLCLALCSLSYALHRFYLQSNSQTIEPLSALPCPQTRGLGRCEADRNPGKEVAQNVLLSCPTAVALAMPSRDAFAAAALTSAFLPSLTTTFLQQPGHVHTDTKWTARARIRSARTARARRRCGAPRSRTCAETTRHSNTHHSTIKRSTDDRYTIQRSTDDRHTNHRSNCSCSQCRSNQ